MNKKRFLSFKILTSLLLITSITGCSNSSDSSVNAIYSKDNKLVISNGKDKRILSDKMSDGGNFNYYYVGWGVEYNNDKTGIYFQSDVAENGNFILNFQDLNTNKKVKISENVYSFKSSSTPSVAYVKDAKDSVGTLCLYKDGKENIIDDGILVSEAVYEISCDGNYIAYLKNENQKECLYLYDFNKNSSIKLGEDIAQFILPQSGDSVFYVEKDKENIDDYNIIKKSFSGESKLLAKRATALLPIENKKDIIFMTNNGEEIGYSEILDDDLYEKDKKITEPKSENYTEKNVANYETDRLEYENKIIRDNLRKEIEGKSFYDYKDDVYVYRNGEAILIEEDVIEAKALNNDGSIMLYSKLEEFQFEKLKISEFSDIDSLMEEFYNKLNSEKKDVYVSIEGSEPHKIPIDNVSIYDFQISKDNKMITFFANSSLDTGSSELYYITIDDSGKLSSPEKIADNVYSVQMSPIDNTIAYMTDYDGVSGTLNVFNNGKIHEVSSTANNYRFGIDESTIYYTDEFNEESLRAVLHEYKDGKSRQIDENVFIIDCKGKGGVVYFKDFDLDNNYGDVYIYNGKKSILIDKQVSCMFFI